MWVAAVMLLCNFRKSKSFFFFLIYCSSTMSPGQVLQSRQRDIDATSQDESPTEQPLDRAFTVLSVVADAARPISVTEVAAICDVPVPSVHRIAAQL